MTAPYLLANGVGNFPDNSKIMADVHYLEALARGNKLQNGGFEDWNAGTSFTNPANAAALADAWTLEKGGTSAATANVTRDGTTKDTGVYAMKVNVTGAGSSNSYLRIKQAVTKFQGYGGRTVLVGCRVKVGTANKVRMSVYDGTTTAYSAYHTGGGEWELLSAPLACAAAPSELSVKVEITSDIEDAVFIDSSFVYHIDANTSASARAALAYEPTDEFVDAGVTSALAAAIVSIDSAEADALAAIDAAIDYFGTLAVTANASPDNKVAVSAGKFRTKDGRALVTFAGGQSPAFDVVSANSRIDLLIINDAGTLTIDKGIEAASPTAPPYPLGAFVLAEVTISDTVTVTISDGDIDDVHAVVRPDHPIASALYATINSRALRASYNPVCINFETKAWDDLGAVTPGAGWVFTAPTTGTYRVRCRIAMAAASVVNLYIYKNGAQAAVLYTASAPGYADIYTDMYGVADIALTATDTIAIYANVMIGSPGGTDGSTTVDVTRNFVAVELL